MMDFPSLYLKVFCGALALPPAFFFTRFVYRGIEPHIRVIIAYFIYYKLTFRRKCLQISGLGLSVLVIYIVANALFLGIGSKGEADLEKRAATIAAMNFMLVFLGGKTNPLADLIRFPLSSYYLAHRCIAVIATAEVVLHSGLILYHRPVFDEFAKSGTIALPAAGGLLLTIVVSLWLRRFLGRFFGLLHLLGAVGVLGGLVWHVAPHGPTPTGIPVFVACGLLGSTHLYRLVRMFLFSHTRATVEKRWDKEVVVQLKLATDKPVKIFPGCYFYVFFNGPLPFYDLFHGYAMTPFWGRPKQFLNGEVSDPTFLITRKGHHAKSLACVSSGDSLRLDGPYGRDLKLYRFETVVLTAKGVGIVGVLPFALQLAGRRRRDDEARSRHARLRDSSEPVFADFSRNVDVIWWLEHDYQDQWVADQLRSLQELDSQNLLVVWCIYPDSKKASNSFEKNKYWSARSNFGFDSFSRELRQETRYPGETIVVASGDAKFVDQIRHIVLQNITSKRSIQFANVDFVAPPGSPNHPSDNRSESQVALVNSTKKNQPGDSDVTGIEMDIVDQSVRRITHIV
ncbi:hypothetical protein FANTH_9535 [Fusarium anthophilum]|uniref:Ferric oxidoreductase domain-containing protein n=1 Tax=Fusarium anthophilum TaxID=48485 RepID=A0A8H4Z606_9HYPO|nr:hypothetical protein FANTH_9535 [Fusarium anthophilum]